MGAALFGELRRALAAFLCPGLAGLAAHLGQGDQALAGGTPAIELELGAAGTVEHPGGARLAVGLAPFLAPAPQREDDRHQIPALGRQADQGASAIAFVLGALDQAVFFKLIEATGF